MGKAKQHKSKYVESRPARSASTQSRADWKARLHRAALAERAQVYGQLETITDKLVDELLRSGHKHALILAAQHAGYFYSRKVNRFVRDMDNPRCVQDLFQ